MSAITRVSTVLPWLVAGALCTIALSVRADDATDRADALVREGAALGEKGQWDEAIARFRAAEAAFPRPMHDCNIGLAYVRSQRHHLGWVYLGRCQVRSTELLPRWVETRRREALNILKRGEYAPVDVSVSPLNVAVRVDTLPGEVFTATVSPGSDVATMTLWLPFGEHVISLTAPEFGPRDVPVRVTSRDAIRVDEVLLPTPVAPDPVATVLQGGERDPVGLPEAIPVPPKAGPMIPTVKASELKPSAPLGAWVTLGSGIAAVAVGAGLYASASNSARAANEASADGNRADYDRNVRAFELERGFSYGLLAVGGAAVCIGTVFLALAGDEDAPDNVATTTLKTVHVRPLHGGGLLSMRGDF